MADRIEWRMEGMTELVAKLRTIGNGMTAEDTLEQSGQAGSQEIINEAKERVRKKTRTLSRSIHVETVEKRRGYVEMDIGTDVVYARIHEFGGTITPKKGKYLAIPLSGTAKALVSPRNFGGRLHKAGMTLQDDSGTVHWVLATATTITPQPYMRPAFDTRGQAALDVAARVLGMLLEKFAK